MRSTLDRARWHAQQLGYLGDRPILLVQESEQLALRTIGRTERLHGSLNVGPPLCDLRRIAKTLAARRL